MISTTFYFRVFSWMACVSCESIRAGTLNLDAQGNKKAVWIFSIGTNFIASSNIAFVGGVGLAKNVCWRVGRHNHQLEVIS
jgi:hypothetical protein